MKLVLQRLRRSGRIDELRRQGGFLKQGRGPGRMIDFCLDPNFSARAHTHTPNSEDPSLPLTQ